MAPGAMKNVGFLCEIGWRIDELRKVSFFLFFSVLFHVLVVQTLAGRQGVGGLLLNFPPDVNVEMVEKMWLNCGFDLLVTKEQVRSSSFSFPNDIRDTYQISSGTRLHSTDSIREAINLLSPKVNRSFLACLSKQKSPLHIYGEESLRNWFVNFLESLLSQRPTLRRSLDVQPSQNQAHASAAAPGPGPESGPGQGPESGPGQGPESGPGPAQAPGPVLAPAPSPQAEPPVPGPAPSSPPAPSPQAEPPVPGPAPSSPPAPIPQAEPPVPGPAPSSPPAPIPQAEPPVPGPAPSSPPAPGSKPGAPASLRGEPAHSSSYFSPGTNDTTSDSVIDNSEKKHDTKNKVIVAVILTAVGTSLCFALIFLCFIACRKSKNYSANSRKGDGAPLYLSELSGSSQESFGTNKIEPLSLKIDLSKQDCVLNLDSSSVVDSTSEALKGTSTSAEPGILAPVNDTTLKPPPKCAPPPGPPPPPKSGPRPPAPPKAGIPPRKETSSLLASNQCPPLGPKQSAGAVPSIEVHGEVDPNGAKIKLKPFFWDKVTAKPDQSMVWDHINAGSFQFNEEAIENLFGYTAPGKNMGDNKKESATKEPQYVRILDPKKAQNLAISLKALNVKTEEVCEALMEGNELPSELLQTLMRMAPTTEEELKLRLHADTSQLGPAEQFMKALIDIPFAFERMEVLLFVASLPEDVSCTTEAFSTIEVACQELRNDRLFLKLLEAVLKTGNRMNDGTQRGDAQAFKLDTLLKLSDVKGTDGKTTLLHFVIREMIRSEGKRAARMTRERKASISTPNSEDLSDDPPIDSDQYFQSLGLRRVSGLSSELENVKKAACLDADSLTSTAASLGERLLKTKEFLETKMEGCEECEFLYTLRAFVKHAEAEITHLLEEERRIRLLVKNTTDYFHDNAGKDEGLRLFVVVRDFLAMVDKVCRQVNAMRKVPPKTSLISETTASSQDLPVMTPRDPRQLLFPAIRDRRTDSFSSSSSSSSDDD